MGEPVESCTPITTAAIGVVAPVLDRIPVLLAPEDNGAGSTRVREPEGAEASLASLPGWSGHADHNPAVWRVNDAMREVPKRARPRVIPAGRMARRPPGSGRMGESNSSPTRSDSRSDRVRGDTGRDPGTTGASMKLVIVSNRLPMSLAEEEGRLEFVQSSGGLASGLRTYLDSPRSAVGAGYAWVGWPGRAVAPDRQAEVTRRCRESFSARPVFLTAEDTKGFYEGYCNQTLWPLFHYFPALVSFDEGPWATYELINEVFCDAVLDEAGPDDTVWVHDYHLLLLPAMLRRRRPGLKVGFFLHIPFPSYELFRLLPDRWRRALLEGMLGADLVGFHTHDYAQHFLKSVRRILGYDHEMGRVMLPDRLSRADTFPMGIAFEAFSARGAEPEVTAQARRAARDDRREEGGPVDRPARLLQGDRQPAAGLPVLPGGQPRLAGPGGAPDGRRPVAHRGRGLPADEVPDRRAGGGGQRDVR